MARYAVGFPGRVNHQIDGVSRQIGLLNCQIGADIAFGSSQR